MALLPKKDSNGRMVYGRRGEFIYELQPTTETVVNIDFVKEHDLGPLSSPADWFEAFVPFFNQNNNTRFSIEKMTEFTNKKLYLKTQVQLFIETIKNHLALLKQDSFLHFIYLMDLVQGQTLNSYSKHSWRTLSLATT